MNEYYNSNNNNKEEIVNLFNVITTYILHLKDSLVIRQTKKYRKGIKSHDILPFLSFLSIYKITATTHKKCLRTKKKRRQDFLNVLTYLDISMDIEMENQQIQEIPCVDGMDGTHF